MDSLVVFQFARFAKSFITLFTSEWFRIAMYHLYVFVQSLGNDLFVTHCACLQRRGVDEVARGACPNRADGDPRGGRRHEGEGHYIHEEAEPPSQARLAPSS